MRNGKARIGELRNRVTIHRPAEVRDSYGDVAGFATPDGPHWMAIERDGGGLRDTGPGEAPLPAVKGACWAEVDVRERDVVKVIEGPESGTAWKVVAQFHAGQRQREVRMDAYTGPDPDPPSP